MIHLVWGFSLLFSSILVFFYFKKDNRVTVKYLCLFGALIGAILGILSHPLKTIFQHKACTDKLYADSFYKVQKNSHSSFEVICCRS